LCERHNIVILREKYDIRVPELIKLYECKRSQIYQTIQNKKEIEATYNYAIRYKKELLTKKYFGSQQKEIFRIKSLTETGNKKKYQLDQNDPRIETIRKKYPHISVENNKESSSPKEKPIPKVVEPKLKVLSLGEKFQVLQMAENGVKVPEIMKKFNSARPTIYKIISEKDEILRRMEYEPESRKRLKMGKYEKINERILSYYAEKLKKNANDLSRQKLKIEALRIARELKNDDFTASNGWLECLIAKYGLKFSDGRRSYINPAKSSVKVESESEDNSSSQDNDDSVEIEVKFEDNETDQNSDIDQEMQIEYLEDSEEEEPEITESDVLKSFETIENYAQKKLQSNNAKFSVMLQCVQEIREIFVASLDSEA
jgi:predicted DNA-binding transcriptional regulator AlpA